MLSITEGLEENEDEVSTGPEPRITEEILKNHCIEQGLYLDPSLNDVLYLHFKGYRVIENLEAYTGLKCIWLDHNRIEKIENLEQLQGLKCLYLQNNLISKIENLTPLQNLDTLNLSFNSICKLEELDTLPNLSSLYLTNNRLETANDILILKACQKLSVVDLTSNRLKDSDILQIFKNMPALRVLSLHKNPVTKLENYRGLFVSECVQLHHLDDRSIFNNGENHK